MNTYHRRTRTLLTIALAVAVAGNLLAADPGPEKGKDQAKGAGPVIIPRFQPPGDAIAISPGTDIQALVDKHPAGTPFVLKSGTHRLQTIRPKDGMSFYGEVGPNGKLLAVLTNKRHRRGAWVRMRRAVNRTAIVTIWKETRSHDI